MNGIFLLRLQHHDRASLLAGKLHAILQRLTLKGRDLYDLLWHLSDPAWPAPHLTLLNHALAQTGWPGAPLTAESGRPAVRARLAGVAWEQVAADVRPFLEPGAAVELLTEEVLRKVLESGGTIVDWERGLGFEGISWTFLRGDADGKPARQGRFCG